MSTQPKLQQTKNYSMFVMNEANRPISEKNYRYKMLKRSMADYGFLPAYPLHCRIAGTKLEIFDGHRRFNVAKELGLPVWYIIYNNGHLSLTRINDVQCPWNSEDYVGSYAQQGMADYRELCRFAANHKLPLGLCAGLLAGNLGAAGVTGQRIRSGDFKVNDSESADKVAHLSNELLAISGVARNARFLNALARCLRVKEFHPAQLVEKARKVPGKLVSHPDIQSFLRMIEDIYNYHSQKPIPLAFMANEASKKAGE